MSIEIRGLVELLVCCEDIELWIVDGLIFVGELVVLLEILLVVMLVMLYLLFMVGGFMDFYIIWKVVVWLLVFVDLVVF